MNAAVQQAPITDSEPPVLAAVEIRKVFTSSSILGPTTTSTAVDGVSLELYRGRTLGIVGESGCGKSTLSRILVGITAATEGRVEIGGVPMHEGSRGERISRLRDVQMVFQSPAGSLDPRMRIGKIIEEPLRIHRRDLGARERAEIVSSIVARVGLDSAHLSRYPHELSGGQQQRVGIARALITNPKVVICDEAVSALDVSVQAQIINLLLDIQKESGVAYIFISHDLSVVASIADEIAVMNRGRIVEEGLADDILSRPKDPYTRVLLESAFVPDPRIEKKRVRQAVASVAINAGA